MAPYSWFLKVIKFGKIKSGTAKVNVSYLLSYSDWEVSRASHEKFLDWTTNESTSRVLEPASSANPKVVLSSKEGSLPSSQSLNSALWSWQTMPKMTYFRVHKDEFRLPLPHPLWIVETRPNILIYRANLKTSSWLSFKGTL